MSKWSITTTDPFYIKDELKRRILSESLIDLSRGEPINTPDILSDSVFQFFWELSLDANRITKDINLKQIRHSMLNDLWINKLENAPDRPVAEACRQFVEEVKGKAKAFSASYSTDVSVLLEIISEIRGEDYLNPAGSFLVRLLMGDDCNKLLHPNTPYTPDTIVMTNGGSEAIGALLELLDFSGFAKEGSSVAMVAPVYSPYKYMLEKGGYNIYGVIGTAKDHFVPDSETLKKFRKQAREKGIRILVLVNPGNPSGVSLPETVLKDLAKIAIEMNMVIIEDVVYADFLDASFSSISVWAPKHTLTVVSMSKFYQAPGTRCGALLINKKTNRHWSQNMDLSCYKKHSDDNVDFYEAFLRAKGPDPWGTFYYTHHVPGPIQWLSTFRLFFGKPDAEQFVNELKARKKAFLKSLGLKDEEGELDTVPYYILLDFLEIIERIHPGLCNEITPEDFIEAVFERAKVALIPAAPFFLNYAEQHKWFVRISMANATELEIKMAAQRIVQLIVDYKVSK